MRELPIKKISQEEYEQIMQNIVNFGGESVICKSDNPGTLNKMFTIPENCMPRQNKINKLNAIYKEGNLRFSTMPISLIKKGDTFTGYEVTYSAEDITLDTAEMSSEIKIFVLTRIKRILEYYASKNITYGDVRGSNILINPLTKSVKFCDIDNIKINDYHIDLMSDELLQLTRARGKVDWISDAYMYNLLTLQQLSYEGATYDDILNLINCGIYPKNFKSKAHKVLDSMLSPKTFNGETIIEYVKK